MLHLTRVFEHRAHQPVDGGKTGFVLIAHGAGDRRLLLHEEPVGSSPRLEVEGTAGSDEELLRLVDRSPLRLSQEPRLVERPADADPEPSERVHVPEPSDALLQVGLE